jgi:nucleoside-diphosphate-sugar epimerase
VTKLLVTGASGFVGRHFVAQAIAAGHEVHSADSRNGDVGDETTWMNMPAADVVVHLAARSFVPDSWKHPAEFIRTNVVGTAHALEHARRSSARFVFLSSYLYGHPARLPIPETAAVLTLNPYALSKKLAEDACAFYADAFDIPITVLRLFNVYGHGQPGAFLLPRVIAQAVAGQEIVVKDLEPRRDYVYIDDVVHAMLKAVARREGFAVFNIGSGVSHSVAELIAEVQRTWGTTATVRSTNERRRDEIMDTVADIAAARRELGWEPTWSLARGLADIHRQST